jgi:acyl carrier protein
MTITEFCTGLVEILELAEPISNETDLKELEEFDSMAIMSLVAYIHKTFGKQFNARQLNNITTVQSLIELIGVDVFDE